MPNVGIQVYVNGCDAVIYRLEGYPLVATRNPVSGTESTSFLIGTADNFPAAHMKLDEVLIWYDILSADEVWHLYLHGGIV